MAGKPGQIRRQHQDDVRRKIQASQIINRLQKHIDGEIELTPSQVSAAKILLDKSVSNAPTEIDQTTELSGTVEHTIRPQLTKEEWMIAHGLGTAAGATK